MHASQGAEKSSCAIGGESRGSGALRIDICDVGGQSQHFSMPRVKTGLFLWRFQRHAVIASPAVFSVFFGGMFLLVIFQARRHREALTLLATQQRAMQAELARLADVLESLVAERPLDESGSDDGMGEWRPGRMESPEEEAAYVPGLEMMLSQGGEEFPDEAESGGMRAEAERREDALFHLSLRADDPGTTSGDNRKGNGMPDLKL